MYSLLIHDDVYADLDAIDAVDPHCAGFLAALVEEWRGDQDLLDRLSQHKYDSRWNSDWASNFNVSRLAELTGMGYNLWRAKSYELAKDRCHHRLIYMFQPQSQTYVLLGIFAKDDIGNYDADGPELTRVRASYAAIAEGS